MQELKVINNILMLIMLIQSYWVLSFLWKFEATHCVLSNLKISDTMGVVHLGQW
jgi:hypothetical protein